MVSSRGDRSPEARCSSCRRRSAQLGNPCSRASACCRSRRLGGSVAWGNALASRARAKKLQPDDVKGGTFTLTNHGISGSLFAFPVINQPQCGILGIGAMQKRVVVIDDAIAIRPMVYLSFAFDHRILDGASADWFLVKVKETLENWS